MKKYLLLILFFLFLKSAVVLADEGLWLLPLIERLNYVDMQKNGLQLTAEEIYSVNHSSLKDAIVKLNIGLSNELCSGSVISKDGLLLTNHHCVYDNIQSVSTVNNDLLKNGFWAATKNEEIYMHKITASFLVRMDDVTSKVLANISASTNEAEREAIIAEHISTIEKETSSGTTYTAKVSSFFQGNEYYLFVYQTFRDVRLVGTPPESLGAFGDATDNWNWPRHAADFTLLRIYMNGLGTPAEYDKKNIPLKSTNFLPISIKGLKKDDFTMMIGYPATTERFLTSFGVALKTDQVLPAIIKVRKEKLLAMTNYMNSSESARLKYASKYMDVDNYYKFCVGQLDELKRMKVYDNRVKTEFEFTEGLKINPLKVNKYGFLFSNISDAYKANSKAEVALTYSREAILQGSDLIEYCTQYLELFEELKAEKINKAKVDKMVASLKQLSVAFYRDFDKATDKKIFTSLLKIYTENVAKEYYPNVMMMFEKKYNSDFNKFSEDLYSQSVFADASKLQRFFLSPKDTTLEKDLAFKIMHSFSLKEQEINEKEEFNKLEIKRCNRLISAGIMEMRETMKFYSDANRTMRLSYGKVVDYAPIGKKASSYYTTLSEMILKEDRKRTDLVIPDKLKDLYKNKEYGSYAENGEMKLCFITNNDQSAGNSGSPVLNGKGELIGLNFDINLEGAASEVAYNADLHRSIVLDIRFLVFMMDKYAGSKDLLNELKIVN